MGSAVAADPLHRARPRGDRAARLSGDWAARLSGDWAARATLPRLKVACPSVLLVAPMVPRVAR